ncbi:MAG: replicative DNA helicase [Chthoniobacterales bacterium]
MPANPLPKTSGSGTDFSLKTSADSPGKARNGFKKNESYLPETHRQLPQSLDAEKGVLSSILLAPHEVLNFCITQKIRGEHFYSPANALVYEQLIELNEKQTPIDIVTLTQALADKNLLDQAGGAANVTELLTFLPTAANASYYIDILKDKYLLRRMIAACTEFAARSYEEQGEVKVLLDDMEKNMLLIGEEHVADELPEIRDHVNKALENIEKLYKNKGGITGISTGFQKLDEMTSGLHGAEMFVIAARPSMGKTALAMNIAEHVAVDNGLPIAVFSLEMAASQLVERLLCSRARVNMSGLRNGFMNKRDIPKLTSAADNLNKAPIYIDETAGLSILELRARARRLHDRYNIKLIVIDYLQLLRSSSRRAQDNRQVEVSEISYGIKALAKELNIPIIVLAQLNRQPEQRDGGKPRLSDLRESGSIEQDADVVALLVRSAYYSKDNKDKDKDGDAAPEEANGEAELIIAKQRNGPVGDIPLTFVKEYTRFETRAFAPEPGE